MRFTKTRNEKTGQEVSIPIKYDKLNGAHIWREREVFDLAIAWEFLRVKGAGWHEFSDDIIKELSSKKIDIPQKIQGERKVVDLLEENPKLTSFFEDKFRKLI